MVEIWFSRRYVPVKSSQELDKLYKSFRSKHFTPLTKCVKDKQVHEDHPSQKSLPPPTFNQIQTLWTLILPRNASKRADRRANRAFVLVGGGIEGSSS